ncbi:MAG: hypothetical protein ACTSVP_13380, partial [Candidatus Heimdallarchaeota archaeon]
MPITIDSNATVIKNFVSDLVTVEAGAGDLKSIGKPCKFNPIIDPKGRIGDYIHHKMNIIDLIPCDYQVGLEAASNSGNAQSNSALDGIEKIRHRLKFEKAIKEYMLTCQNYKLPLFSGLRLHTTDETTSTDEFRNSY